MSFYLHLIYIYIFIDYFNRTNPSPAQFRSHIRDCMVDSCMATTIGQNCQDDMNDYLFTLENLKAVGSNLAIKNRLEKDIPEEIRGMMSGAPTLPPLEATFLPNTPLRTLSPIPLEEVNILKYIGGYLLFKLIDLICSDCLRFYEKDKNKESVTPLDEVFIQYKEYQDVKVGLHVPSDTFVRSLIMMEDEFRKSTRQNIHSVGIRKRIIENTLKRVDNTECGACQFRFFMVCLFTNVRIHHHIKCLNQAWLTSNKRKCLKRKLSTVSGCS